MAHHVKVYAEPGRFGGWPANHGLWAWGDEILVGFSAGYAKDNGPDRHAIDHDSPEEHLLARSKDGGETWAVEDPAAKGALVPAGKVLHGAPPPGVIGRPWRDCPGGIDFTHPDFALTARMTDTGSGPSRFYYSTDRGKTWDGPFRLPLFGRKGVAARTDYQVTGRGECLLFLTAAKADGKEGRPFCARTVDGGRTWEFVGWIGDEPAGYAIMPSTVRLAGNLLLTAIRCREGDRSWIDTYRSGDGGKSWALDRPAAVADTGEGKPDEAAQKGLKLLLKTVGAEQTENGSWSTWPATRPPIFGTSDESLTALATLAILPAAAAGDTEAKAARDKAVKWLADTKTDGDPQSAALRLVLWARLGRMPTSDRTRRTRSRSSGAWCSRTTRGSTGAQHRLKKMKPVTEATGVR